MLMFSPGSLFETGLVKYPSWPRIENKMNYVWMSLLLFGLLAWTGMVGSPHVLRWLGIGCLALGVFQSEVRVSKPILASLGLVFYLGLSLFWSPDWRGGLFELSHILALWFVFCAFAFGLIEKSVTGAIALAFAIALSLQLLWPESHGGFGNENWIAEWLLIASPFVLAFFWKENGLKNVGAGLFLGGGIVYLLLVNPSRIVFFVGLGLVVIALLLNRRWFASIFTLAVISNVIILTSASLDYFKSSFLPRGELWMNTALMWKEAPFFGNGLGSFNYLYDSFREGHLQFFPDYGTTLHPFVSYSGSAHNEFLQSGAELGLVGLALLGVFLFLTVKVKFGSAAFWSVMIAGLICLISSPLQNPATALLVAVSLGILARDAKEVVLGSKALLALPALALISGLLFMSTSSVLASRSFSAGQVALYSDPIGGFLHLWRAYEIQPLDWEIRRELALGLAVIGRVVPPSEDLAERVYNISRSAAPNAPLVLFSRVEYLLNSGLWKENEAEIENHLAQLRAHASLQQGTEIIALAYSKLKE